MHPWNKNGKHLKGTARKYFRIIIYRKAKIKNSIAGLKYKSQENQKKITKNIKVWKN